jgi:hypothetical protein
MISALGAGGVHRGDGQNLSVWIRRMIPALFAAPVTGGIDKPASVAAPVSDPAVAVTQNLERKRGKASSS